MEMEGALGIYRCQGEGGTDGYWQNEHRFPPTTRTQFYALSLSTFYKSSKVVLLKAQHFWMRTTSFTSVLYLRVTLLNFSIDVLCYGGAF